VSTEIGKRVKKIVRGERGQKKGAGTNDEEAHMEAVWKESAASRNSTGKRKEKDNCGRSGCEVKGKGPEGRTGNVLQTVGELP